ncbi:dTDP-4-dehydrorhamnose reductase [bacterium]|nr:dTDP-4-dehydrorhamnose reductase [bacterium]
MLALVTGGNGMFAGDLAPILEDEGYDVILCDIEDFDLCNEDAVRNYILAAKPDLIIHAAGYTNVEQAEAEPELAMNVNGLGTKYVAHVAREIDVPLVYISTDYVFDGEKKTQYVPDDATNPLNVYGKTKLEGENYVKEICERYYIVRTSWLYGTYGKNFVQTMLMHKNDEEIKVVNDQIGSPTWTVDLADGIIKILNMPYGTYHVSGSGKCSWYEFACEIFSAVGADVKVIPVPSVEVPQKAKRPAFSSMKPSIKTKNWKESLKNYLFISELEVD